MDRTRSQRPVVVRKGTGCVYLILQGWVLLELCWMQGISSPCSSSCPHSCPVDTSVWSEPASAFAWLEPPAHQLWSHLHISCGQVLQKWIAEARGNYGVFRLGQYIPSECTCDHPLASGWGLGDGECMVEPHWAMGDREWDQHGHHGAGMAHRHLQWHSGLPVSPVSGAFEDFLQGSQILPALLIFSSAVSLMWLM